MTRVIFIFMFSIIVCSSIANAETDLECGPNEVQDDCPTDCPADNCPKNEEEAKITRCDQPENCPPPKCKCRFNHRRASNGTCIPTTDCPPFKCTGKFQEYNPCPPVCPNGSCAQATLTQICPLSNIGNILECSPACRCIRNYYFKNGVCVPLSQCS